MKRKALIALVLGIALTVVPAASAMWLSDGGSNSTALKLTPQQAQFYALHGTVPSTYVGVERSIRLTPKQAQFYVLHGIVPGTGRSVSVAPLKTTDSSFQWSDAAIGAAAVLAAMLLAAATVIGARRRSRLSF